MRFPPSFLDEIRNRVPVSAVVGKRVRLKKQGRELAGLSPFTKEKTPSFFVNDDKRFYHCFSSGKHGDIFTFLMETEGVSFPEAVERLAGEAGLPMPKADPQAQARERERAGLHEVMEMAAAFFQAQLAERARGQRAFVPGPARGIAGDPRGLRYRLCALRAPSSQGVPCSARRRGLADGGGRSDHNRGRHPGAVRPVPRPGDVPHSRHARPGYRLWRARAQRGTEGQVPELAGNAAVPQGRHAVQHRRRAQGRPRRRHRARRRRLHGRDRHDRGRLRQYRRAAGYRAHGQPACLAVAHGGRAGAVLRRRFSGIAGRHGGPPNWRCRTSSRARACNSR